MNGPVSSVGPVAVSKIDKAGRDRKVGKSREKFQGHHKKDVSRSDPKTRIDKFI